jgi:putative heme iron utilization protein
MPENKFTFVIASNQALKNCPVSLLCRNKKNYFVFRSNMLTVLQNTRIEGRNLIEICFIDDNLNTRKMVEVA